MHETATYVTLEDVVQHAISHTLADEPVDRTPVLGIALERIAHEYDLHVSDIVVQAADIIPSGDFTWGVDLIWSVQCEECSRDAVIGVPTKFSQPMCQTHRDEAYEQDLADQHNDDIALGLA